VNGATVTTPRVSGLLDSNGNYFTMAPPTYQQYSASQFINIKDVSGVPVYGDGVTDDTANINAILAKFAGCRIIYFPAGTYIVTNTIFVPAGSIIVGDAYASAISAVGSQFWNPNAPVTMVRVGNAGDVGVAQISDMMFTVADVLQGCKLVSYPTKSLFFSWRSNLSANIILLDRSRSILQVLPQALLVSGTLISALAVQLAAKLKQIAPEARIVARRLGV
jgi:hypothetical protein